MTAAMITPVTVLKKMLELDKYTAALDIHRMDKNGLYAYMNHLLSDQTISKLNSFHDPSTNKEIILSALKSGRLLSFTLMKELANQLRKIESPGDSTEKKISEFLLNGKQTEYWDKNRVWVISIIVVLISLTIFLASKN